MCWFDFWCNLHCKKRWFSPLVCELVLELVSQADCFMQISAISNNLRGPPLRLLVGRAGPAQLGRGRPDGPDPPGGRKTIFKSTDFTYLAPNCKKTSIPLKQLCFQEGDRPHRSRMPSSLIRQLVLQANEMDGSCDQHGQATPSKSQMKLGSRGMKGTLLRAGMFP